MKILDKIFMLVFIVMLIGIMIGYRSCNNLKQELKESEASYDDLTHKFDSILASPPDTIVKPAVIIKKDSLIYITKWIKEPTEDAKTYRDSIINEEIDVRLEIVAKDLFSVNYEYKPIYKYQERIIEKKIPYPVTVIKEIKVPQSGIYLNAGLGFSDRFSGKVGLTFLTKKKDSYSYDLVRYGEKNIHFVSYGIKF